MEIKKLKFKKINNKRGGFVDIFIFMIMAFIIVTICGVFIYMGNTVKNNLISELGEVNSQLSQNTTDLVNDTMGKYNTSLKTLYWLSALLIMGMIVAIFVGSFLVVTRPVFFVPYIFIMVIAVLVAVPISNTYEQLLTDEELGSTYQGFRASNFILMNLPIWVVIIGFIGAIIMFARLNQGREEFVGF